MVSSPDKSTIVDEHPLDRAGETLLRGLDQADKKLNEDESIIFDKGCDPTKISMITLERDAQGLGFNIVGGKDSQHIPGHSGIFVSIIKADGPAYKDGRLSVGDLVLSINGVGLIDKTHDEAVSIFRSQNQSTVDLLVEVGAENRILNEHLSADFYVSAAKSALDSENEVVKRTLTPTYRKSFGDGYTLRSSPSPAGDLKGQEEDSESITSGAPSVHSILDDVPRTPKRPMSYLDPRNPSLVTEVLYVSIGLAVISLGVFVVYRLIRRRR
ncbi:hypothetical protein V3C99_014120 [Haemonchus contortus]|nr:PDZ domain containing protein [Haemonchus contortus]